MYYTSWKELRATYGKSNSRIYIYQCRFRFSWFSTLPPPLPAAPSPTQLSTLSLQLIDFAGAFRLAWKSITAALNGRMTLSDLTVKAFHSHDRRRPINEPFFEAPPVSLAVVGPFRLHSVHPSPPRPSGFLSSSPFKLSIALQRPTLTDTRSLAPFSSIYVHS